MSIVYQDSIVGVWKLSLFVRRVKQKNGFLKKLIFWNLFEKLYYFKYVEKQVS